jgi:trimeric autotransporter adhesin
MNSRFNLRVVITGFIFISLPVFLFAAPGNDLCSNATTLTPNTTCSTIRGDLYLASDESISTSTCGTTNDVWYKFTVPSNAISTTISVSMDNGNTATNSNTYIEVFSASLCSSISTLTTLGCSGVASSLTLSLTAGSTYYFRVFTTVSTGGNSGKYGFDICVSYTTPPSNDDCSGAVTLASAVSCSNTSGTLNNATSTTGLPAGCESGGTHYDVWYKFVAASTYELISLSSLGSNFTNPELQLYSGTCGSLTSVQCGTTSMTATGLTVSTTYYVRISNINTAITANGGFSICVYHPASATYDYGKSYVNITRNSGGGTINPGDTLEIRGTFVVRSQSLDSLAFFDTLRNGGGVRLIPGTIALRTNEGKIYRSDSPTKSAFTDAFDADAGYRYQNGLDTIIRINFGAGATNLKRGSLSNTSNPSVFGGTCIIMATYRVVVYASYNSSINLGGGAITIKDANTGVSGNLSFSTRNAIVYSSPGLCPNAVSATNAIGGDFNGTFGTPAVSAPLARNRGTSSNVPGYIYKPFTNTGGPNDYYYAIANNTSQIFTTTTTWPKPTTTTTYRVFNVWDISGDHTGATNTAKGNPPCDTTKPRSATNPCGYMLVINSAYKTDTAFQYSVTNLCPNTYYEISTWVKNICYKCSCDSNGTGASGAGYIPFATNDSSGVQPNLAFDINGTDYYSTGNIAYAGIYPTTQAGSDSTNTWVKRGFTYKTGLSQSSLTLTIRNNAPGGGGNDWALDDISLATCLPNMNYSPSLAPIVCDSNYLDITDTVRSYFNNYADYIWQRSTDNGTTWADIPGTQGAGTPVWNGSAWEYVSAYRIPKTATNLADSGDLYRVIVATTSLNLGNSNCQLTDGVSTITLKVINCYSPLNIDMLSFSGKLITGHANLFWSTSRENEAVHFEIEKSSDRINFTKIGTVNGYTNYSSEVNHYSFINSLEFSGKTWYRIIMINNKGGKKYSRIIQITDEQIVFGLNNIVNPFRNELSFEIITTSNAKIDVSLIELFGKKVKAKSFTVYSGINDLSIVNTEGLTPGIYILQVKNKDIVINNKVVKK